MDEQCIPDGSACNVVNASFICIYYRKIQTVVIDGMLLYSNTQGWAGFVNAFSYRFRTAPQSLQCPDSANT